MIECINVRVDEGLLGNSPEAKNSVGMEEIEYETKNLDEENQASEFKEEIKTRGKNIIGN